MLFRSARAVAKKPPRVQVEARDPEDDADVSATSMLIQGQQNPWTTFNQTKGGLMPASSNGTNVTNISYLNTTETCPDDCSGHGFCNANVQCECDEGYVGYMCDMPRCLDDCNDRGLCIVQECICDSAFYGAACQHIRCEADCNGNGYCFQGECMCKDAWTGHDCGTPGTGGGTEKVALHKMEPKAAPGAIDVRKETSTLRKFNDDSCPNNCNNRGNCNDGTCHCFTGYSGATCSDVCPNECSHQGTCSEGACICFAGFLGVDCSVRGCCNGHGTCNAGEIGRAHV